MPTTLLITLLRPHTPPRPRNLSRKLHLIITPQLHIFMQPIPLPLTLTHSESPILLPTPIATILSSGIVVVIIRRIVFGWVAAVAGEGIGGGGGGTAGAGRDPPATEERREGGEAGADDADEGLAAGPDEDAGHGPS